MKVTNAEIYSQIDWDLEIANEDGLDEDGHAKGTSDAVFVLQEVKDMFDRQIEENGVEDIEPHEKANMMRMIEYFHCKFISSCSVL